MSTDKNTGENDTEKKVEWGMWEKDPEALHLEEGREKDRILLPYEIQMLQFVAEKIKEMLLAKTYVMHIPHEPYDIEDQCEATDENHALKIFRLQNYGLKGWDDKTLLEHISPVPEKL